jgi:carotenoid cleavage dioxygenase-like enzyme
VLTGPEGGIARVNGSFPSWLRGRLVRTAPAVFERNGWRARHWFDGLGMLYRFTVEAPDRVLWAQRLLDCEAVRASASGRIPLATFASGNGRSLLRRIFEPIPRRTDNTNVHVVPIGADWLAMTETDRQLAIDPETLATRREVTYDDDLPEGMAMTAHPHFDFERNQLVNVGIVTGARAELVVYSQARGSSRRQPVGRWAVTDIPYVHSFALTPESAILVAHPMTYRAVTLLWSNEYLDHMKWRPSYGTRLVVVDRASGAARFHETDTFFMFHTVNAFRDGRDLVLDVLAHDDPSGMTRAFRIEQMHAWSSPPLARLTRIRMTEGRSRATVERLTEERFELPSISYRARTGQRHGVVWGASIGAQSAILRVDLERSEVVRYASPGFVFGEPVFVPAPSASAEDDGVLLAVGCDPATSRTKLAAIDARRMEGLAEAVVETPLPLGFHGSFESAAFG